jgi:hypothetical protein
MRDDDGERDEKAKLVRAIDEKARLVRAIIWLFLLVSSIGILAVNYMGYSLPDYVFGAAAVFSITGILAAVFVLFEKFIVWFVASRVRAIILLFVIMSSIGILAANLTGHCGPLPTRLCTETSSTELLRLSPSRLSREQVTPASPDWFPR